MGQRLTEEFLQHHRYRDHGNPREHRSGRGRSQLPSGHVDGERGQGAERDDGQANQEVALPLQHERHLHEIAGLCG